MEFPDDFTELGTAIADADSILVNKRYTTFTRVKTWILSLVGTTSGTLTAGNDSRLSDTRTPTDASVTTAKLDATLFAKIARLTAKRAISGTAGTLAITDKILAVNASGNFTLTLPSVASASGLEFLLQRVDIASAYTLTLALDAGDTGAKIYYQANSPSAGASLVVTGADSQTRPGFLLWSDGTDWYIA